MRKVGPWVNKGNLPYLIAEIGGNHEGDFAYAKDLCSLALESGADCVKFQLYTGSSLTNSWIDPGRTAHFSRFELTPEQHLYLAEMCRDADVDYSASVWNAEMLSWIDHALAFYKIGSGDLTAYSVTRMFAETGKPIVLSTGLSTMEEVEDAVEFLRTVNPVYRDPDYLAVLQCTSMYPIEDSDANLAVMAAFREKLACTVGYSDHTRGSMALCVAAMMGAKVLEFHFTDSREGKSFRDHIVSLTSNEVRKLRRDLDEGAKYVGSSLKKPLDIEKRSGHVTSFRRAVFPARDIPAGATIAPADLICLRPNKGIDARQFDMLIGRKVKKDLVQLQVLDWTMFDH